MISQKKAQRLLQERSLIGRHEWCSLPELGVPLIKGKVDTGAMTSAIHALNITRTCHAGIDYALFEVHPLQNNNEVTIICRAPIVDHRQIMSSNGQKEARYIIQTTLVLGEHSWPIEISLSNREPLKYRLLLGREALGAKVLIDPNHSCHLKSPSKSEWLAAYPQPKPSH